MQQKKCCTGFLQHLVQIYVQDVGDETVQQVFRVLKHRNIRFQGIFHIWNFTLRCGLSGVILDLTDFKSFASVCCGWCSHRLHSWPTLILSIHIVHILEYTKFWQCVSVHEIHQVYSCSLLSSLLVIFFSFILDWFDFLYISTILFCEVYLKIYDD